MESLGPTQDPSLATKWPPSIAEFKSDCMPSRCEQGELCHFTFTRHNIFLPELTTHINALVGYLFPNLMVNSG